MGARAWSILWSIALLAARAWSIRLSIALFGEQARARFRVSACWEQRFLNVEIYHRVSVFGEYGLEYHSFSFFQFSAQKSNFGAEYPGSILGVSLQYLLLFVVPAPLRKLGFYSMSVYSHMNL